MNQSPTCSAQAVGLAYLRLCLPSAFAQFCRQLPDSLQLVDNFLRWRLRSSLAPRLADVLRTLGRSSAGLHRTFDCSGLDLRLWLLHQKLPITLGFSSNANGVYANSHFSRPTLLSPQSTIF